MDLNSLCSKGFLGSHRVLYVCSQIFCLQDFFIAFSAMDFLSMLILGRKSIRLNFVHPVLTNVKITSGSIGSKKGCPSAASYLPFPGFHFAFLSVLFLLAA